MIFEVPWKDNKEFIELYEKLFISCPIYHILKNPNLNSVESINNLLENKYLSEFDGYIHLKKWIDFSIDLPLIKSTYLLLDILDVNLKNFKDNRFTNKELVSINFYNLIQIVNLIIDELKKRKKLSQNMFEIAKKINFPLYIIELRHIATHGNIKMKDEINILFEVFRAFIDIFIFIHINFWEKQYNTYIDEIYVVETLIEYINNISEKISLELFITKKICSKRFIFKETKIDFINLKYIYSHIFKNYKLYLIDLSFSELLLKESLINIEKNKNDMIPVFLISSSSFLKDKITFNSLEDIELIDYFMCIWLKIISITCISFGNEYYTLEVLCFIKNYYLFLKYINKDFEKLFRKSLISFEENFKLFFLNVITYDTKKILENHFNDVENNIFYNEIYPL